MKDATKGKIADLLKPGDLTPLTRLVLTNAVYFKGAWTTPFDPKMTHDGRFTCADGKAITLPMMSREDTFTFLQGDAYQAVRLPYGAGKMAMYLYLPADGKSVADVLPRLADFAPWAKATDMKMVVALPRFKAGFEAKLNAPLTALGMGEAFSMQADFSGMNGQKNLYLSFVRHKAVLEVNEEGATAAAATGVGVALKSMPFMLRFDRPFLFAIRDENSGALVFAGVINKPE